MWRGCAGHKGCGWVSEKREEQKKERERESWGFDERDGFVLFFPVRVMERERERERETLRT